MATLDDKLLGEKLQNYCSSSSEDEGDDKNDERSSSTKGPKFIPEAEIKEKGMPNLGGGGPAQNTGPKGVIRDWQRYKQLENEKNSEAQEERRQLLKRLAMTCRSEDVDKSLDKEGISKDGAAASSSGAAASAAAAAAVATGDPSDKDLENDLLQDEFFKEYIRKKFEEMQNRNLNLPRFGKVVELTNENFLDQIDNENKNVTIIIHIYDSRIAECRLMNECLDQIAPNYAIVKFCRVRSGDINLSEKFKKSGCPALLIYKNGELIGNFVKMGDEFGQEFCASDVENFLIEQGFLPSQDVPSLIRSSNNNKDDMSDDD